MNKIPVLCICFNRHRFAKQLFFQLRSMGYNEIFLSIDGPRNDNDRSEQVKIINEANFFFDNLHLNTLSSNHGVSLGPVKALDWFFNRVDFGIVLEDDILPSRSFFVFVYEMYKKFNKVQRVLTINAGSFSTQPENSDHKYYFSSYTHIWGWATWSYVWKQYNVEIASSDIWNVLNGVEWQSPREKNYWLRNMLKDSRFHWDFQLSYLSFKLNGLNVTPTRTLAQNIGFAENSSHIFFNDPIRERIAFIGNLPSKIPQELMPDRKLDYLTFKETRSYDVSRLLRIIMHNNPIKLLKICFRKIFF